MYFIPYRNTKIAENLFKNAGVFWSYGMSYVGADKDNEEIAIKILTQAEDIPDGVKKE